MIIFLVFSIDIGFILQIEDLSIYKPPKATQIVTAALIDTVFYRNGSRLIVRVLWCSRWCTKVVPKCWANGFEKRENVYLINISGKM